MPRIECTVPIGLEDIAAAELQELAAVCEVATSRGLLRFDATTGQVRRLCTARTVLKVSIEHAGRLHRPDLDGRRWRVRHTPGCLSPAIAAAIVRMTRPSPKDVFLNLACGSGTFAIERALAGDATLICAVDIDECAMQDARDNGDSASVADRMKLIRADGRSLPLPTDTFDVVVAALPYGLRVGDHRSNAASHDGLIREAVRVTRRRARICILTNEFALMQQVLGSLASSLRLDRMTRIAQGGVRPGVFLMRRL